MRAAGDDLSATAARVWNTPPHGSKDPRVKNKNVKNTKAIIIILLAIIIILIFYLFFIVFYTIGSMDSEGNVIIYYYYYYCFRQ